MLPPLDQVCDAFPDHLAGAKPPCAPSPPAEIAAYEKALGVPLPREYRRFCERMGRGTGPLSFSGAHVGLDTRLAEVSAAWEAKRSRRKRRGETGPPKAILFGLAIGTCQDCGPAFLDLTGDLAPRSVRAAVRPADPGSPLVLQIDWWRGDRTEGTLLAESLAALVFAQAFERFVLAPLGPARAGSITLPTGERAPGFPAALDAALAPLGFERHPLSRFPLASHHVHATGRAAIAMRPDPNCEPPTLRLVAAASPRRLADEALERIAPLARMSVSAQGR
ncbi:MAG: SMI1/KNR4 family protein [Planctomycetales bacterium]|nr:SMI1/KNR4 family protein [Planctomycetales bacterium]